MCDHTNEILDEHEGYFVCTDCGLVKDQYFTQNVQLKSKKDFKCGAESLTKNILDKINMAEYYTDCIDSNLASKGKIANI